MNIQEVTQLAMTTLDRNRDGNIEISEMSDFLNTLEETLRRSEGAAPATESSLARPSALSSLAASANPGHDLKVLLNDTLVDVSRELGLSLTSIPGASYPAVAELRPGPGGELTSEQAYLRQQITTLVSERLATDPALPEDVRVTVENPGAGSGADRIAFTRGTKDPLVFDVITGAGILKSRIAKNYLAERYGQTADQAHSIQFELLGNIGSRLSASADAYRRLAPPSAAE